MGVTQHVRETSETLGMSEWTRRMEDIGLNVRIVDLRGVRVRVCRQDSSVTGNGPVIGFCEYVNEPSGSVKAENVLGR